MTNFIEPIDALDIEVIEPILVTNNNSKMEAVAEKQIDVTQLSEEQLLALLKQKKAQKNNDREAYKKLVEEVTPKALLRLAVVSEQLSNAKKETFEFFENILKLKADVYGTKENQQTHTFSTETSEITIGYRVNDGWDDTVGTGITKVKTFISSLARDKETAALVEMVFDLLKQDKAGNLKGSRVLELKKLTEKFNNTEFTDGVDIIANSYKPVRSSWFIEAYTINPDNGVKTNIPLSMSSVEFPGGYTFNYNTKTETDGSTND